MACKKISYYGWRCISSPDVLVSVRAKYWSVSRTQFKLNAAQLSRSEDMILNVKLWNAFVIQSKIVAILPSWCGFEFFGRMSYFTNKSGWVQHNIQKYWTASITDMEKSVCIFIEMSLALWRIRELAPGGVRANVYMGARACVGVKGCVLLFVCFCRHV